MSMMIKVLDHWQEIQRLKDQGRQRYVAMTRNSNPKDRLLPNHLDTFTATPFEELVIIPLEDTARWSCDERGGICIK